MKVLFIGGTGNISTATSQVALEDPRIELFHLNRGQRVESMAGVTTLKADVKNSEEVRAAIGDHHFDVVVNFIAFTPEDIDRDFEVFQGRCGQYIFISSASAYQKPLQRPVVTEDTPLKNPYWQYSRNKIASEERVLYYYREHDFPGVNVRPSYTYDKIFPLALGGGGHFTAVDRMRKGKGVIVHGDGTSLWTVTHSEDFSRGLVGLFGNEQTHGEAFHITSDEVLNWNQIYLILAKAAGVADPKLVHISSEHLIAMNPDWEGGLLGDKAESVILDNSKIKRFVPGFQARIPWREGARRLMEYFEADPARQVINDQVNELFDRIIAAYPRPGRLE